MAQGRRRYDNKQKGFGGQKKPIFKKKAKKDEEKQLYTFQPKTGENRLNVIKYDNYANKVNMNNKKGKESSMAQGRRRYDNKQKGFGGQKKPIFKKKAKTTKKVVLRLECSECKKKSLYKIKRCKTFVLGGTGKVKSEY